MRETICSISFPPDALYIRKRNPKDGISRENSGSIIAKGRRSCAYAVLHPVKKCDILLRREKAQKTLDLSKIGRKIVPNAENTFPSPKTPDCGQTLQDNNVKNVAGIVKILLAIPIQTV